MITKAEIYGIILVVLGLAIGAAYLKGHNSGYVEGKQEIQVQFDRFVNDTKAAGLKAEADKLAKEKEDAKRLDDAVATRNDALKRLLDAQTAARTRFRAVPRNPTAPSGSSKVCFNSGAYNAAFQQFGAGITRFLQDTSGFAYEGDSANLDAKALIQAWPSPGAVPAGAAASK